MGNLNAKSTISDVYLPAYSVRTTQEAGIYLKRIIDFIIKFEGADYAEAVRQARHDLVYYMYYGFHLPDEEIKRLVHLYNLADILRTVHNEIFKSNN